MQDNLFSKEGSSPSCIYRADTALLVPRDGSEVYDELTARIDLEEEVLDKLSGQTGRYFEGPDHFVSFRDPDTQGRLTAVVDIEEAVLDKLSGSTRRYVEASNRRVDSQETQRYHGTAATILAEQLSQCMLEPFNITEYRRGRGGLMFHTQMSTTYLLASGDQSYVLKLFDLSSGQDFQMNKKYLINEALIHRRCQELNPKSTPRLLVAGIRESLGCGYMLMEYVAGPSIGHHYLDDGHDPKSIITTSRDTAEHLQNMHDAGLVHRDIKPIHIIMGHDVTKVIDYGLAIDINKDNGRAYTDKKNCVVGTPQYLAPEAFTTDNVAPAFDVYSLGVVLFEAATGKRLFESDKDLSLLHKQKKKPLLSVPLREGYPEELSSIIQKCVHPKPHKRPVADELAHGLDLIASSL